MRTVVITGIGKGIGRALAEKFLAEGFRVIGTYRGTSPDIRQDQLTSIPLDLADSRSIDACVRQIAQADQAVDILINNAGVLLDEECTAVVPSLLRDTLTVNVIGTAQFTEAMIPHVARGGHIVNISSTAGSITLARTDHGYYPRHYPAYKISKAALNMYTATLATRLADEGITVSAVHPGWVRTEMGGSDADLSPQEAAEGIYATAVARPETGGFWFRGERLPW